ncbi:MAG: hypothetical protein OXE84_02620 [Rhodobacteraceae bacterium]|nr:hypothetical protein [Paracoccaceae bacterium]MCY4198075.1 hypothetical protein [Paracoccaceae bacterium]
MMRQQMVALSLLLLALTVGRPDAAAQSGPDREPVDAGEIAPSHVRLDGDWKPGEFNGGRFQFNPEIGEAIAAFLDFVYQEPVTLILDQWQWNENSRDVAFSPGTSHRLVAGGHKVFDIDTVNMHGTVNDDTLALSADRINLWNERGDLTESMIGLDVMASHTVSDDDQIGDDITRLQLGIDRQLSSRVWNADRRSALTVENYTGRIDLTAEEIGETETRLRLIVHDAGGRFITHMSADSQRVEASWSVGHSEFTGEVHDDSTGQGALRIVDFAVEAPGGLRVDADRLLVAIDESSHTGFVQVSGFALSPELQARFLPLSALGAVDMRMDIRQIPGPEGAMAFDSLRIEQIKITSGVGRIVLTGDFHATGYQLTGEATGLREMLLDAGVPNPASADALLVILGLAPPDANDRIPLMFAGDYQFPIDLTARDTIGSERP